MKAESVTHTDRFETGSQSYLGLNDMIAVGVGSQTALGPVHEISEAPGVDASGWRDVEGRPDVSISIGLGIAEHVTIVPYISDQVPRLTVEDVADLCQG